MPRRNNIIEWVEREPDPDKRYRDEYLDLPEHVSHRWVSGRGPGGSRGTTRNHQAASKMNGHSNHVTRPVKIKEYVVDINSCPNHLASRISRTAGGKRTHIDCDSFNILKCGLDRETRIALNEVWSDSMHGLKAYPNFELNVDPRYFRPVSRDTSHALGLCAAYRCYNAIRITREIGGLVSDLKYFWQEHKEYLAHIKALEDLPVSNIATQHQRITHQLEEEQAKLEAFAKLTAPDESVRRQLLRKTTSLERTLDLLTLHLNKKTCVETAIESSDATAKEILKQYEESRSSIFEQLQCFKIITGSDMMLTTPTSGVFTFNNANLRDYYNFFLEDSLVDVLSKNELKDFLLSCPTRYYYEVPRIFKDTPLHNVKLPRNTFDNFDNILKFIEAWESADVVATFAFDDAGYDPNINGYALFKCNESSENAIYYQALKHFDDLESMDIKIIHSHRSHCYGEGYDTNAIIAYSFSGRSWRLKTDLPEKSSKLTIINQNALENTDCYHRYDERYQCCRKCHGQHYGCDLARSSTRGIRDWYSQF